MIQEALDGFYAFLDRPLFLWSRPLLVLLLVPLAIGISAPLWHIRMEAPQYPDGLTLDIYAHRLESGHDGNDLREINILNHYIGMRKIDVADLQDLSWLPFGFGLLALLALRVAVVGNVRSLLDLTAITAYFSIFAFGRFVYKLHAYGHQLSPDAPVKIPPFTPPIFGTKEVGNFTTAAGPGTGSYLVAAFVAGLVAIAVTHLVAGRRDRDQHGFQRDSSSREVGQRLRGSAHRRGRRRPTDTSLHQPLRERCAGNSRRKRR